MGRVDDAELLGWIAEVAGARSAERGAEIQSLWSGYGSLFRVRLDGGPRDSVVVKQVAPQPVASNATRAHPRGWASDVGHDRKLRSYQVEAQWYATFAKRCGAGSRVPACLAVRSDGPNTVFVLEDLDASGYPGRRSELDAAELDRCLSWLAQFHATFLGVEPKGLWEVGSYWHLATRPDELAALADRELRDAAGRIDARLNSARFRTFVHGDAKLANFCFGDADVAAVDFQYVGGGCGMKDVAYFLSSCLSSKECARQGDRVLDDYFRHLRAGLPAQVDADALEEEWRTLYPLAWADFQRFLGGWAPGHWKLGAYAERQTRAALKSLG